MVLTLLLINVEVPWFIVRLFDNFLTSNYIISKRKVLSVYNQNIDHLKKNEENIVASNSLCI